jgi:hypothetical protein
MIRGLPVLALEIPEQAFGTNLEMDAITMSYV